MLEKQLNDVLDFHLKVTGQPVPLTPTMIIGGRRDYALKFLHEELAEFQDATTIADQADAMIDLIYVAYGRLLEMGIKPGPAFQLVHEANLKKERGPTKRGGQWDAMKPEGWLPPDWSTFLGLEKGAYIGLRRTNPHDNSCKPKPKILLLGYGRHGKDTVAEKLRDGYGFSFTSSSMACAEEIMLPFFQKQRLEWLNGPKQGLEMPVIYNTAKQCFEDRHNRRATWFQQIEAFNTPDKSALGKLIFRDYDIYCGLRSAREFAAVKNTGLYDACIWVDRSQHVPPEDRSSCTVEPWMADYVLDNNGSLEELDFNLKQLMETILA